MTDLHDDAHARALDAADPLSALRGEFLLPRHGGAEQAYFCGNSLGLQPRAARAHVEGDARHHVVARVAARRAHVRFRRS